MTLLYFAWLRQIIGRGEEKIDLPPQTLRALIAHLKTRGPEYAGAFADENRIRAAINQEHVGLDAIAASDDEVAFFPPVTGG